MKRQMKESFAEHASISKDSVKHQENHSPPTSTYLQMLELAGFDGRMRSRLEEVQLLQAIRCGGLIRHYCGRGNLGLLASQAPAQPPGAKYPGKNLNLVSLRKAVREWVSLNGHAIVGDGDSICDAIIAGLVSYQAFFPTNVLGMPA